jgi:hypothetical protein
LGIVTFILALAQQHPAVLTRLGRATRCHAQNRCKRNTQDAHVSCHHHCVRLRAFCSSSSRAHPQLFSCPCGACARLSSMQARPPHWLSPGSVCDGWLSVLRCVCARRRTIHRVSAYPRACLHASLAHSIAHTHAHAVRCSARAGGTRLALHGARGRATQRPLHRAAFVIRAGKLLLPRQHAASAREMHARSERESARKDAARAARVRAAYCLTQRTCVCVPAWLARPAAARNPGRSRPGPSRAAPPRRRPSARPPSQPWRRRPAAARTAPKTWRACACACARARREEDKERRGEEARCGAMDARKSHNLGQPRHACAVPAACHVTTASTARP